MFLGIQCCSYSVVTIYVVHVMLPPMLNVLYFYISTFSSMWGVPSKAVLCSSKCHVLQICSSDIFWMIFRWFQLHLLLQVLLSFFTFHIHCISIVRSLYFKIFSAYLLITFQSPEIAMYINRHVPFSLPQIIMSSLLLGMVLLVSTCWFHNMVTLL